MKRVQFFSLVCTLLFCAIPTVAQTSSGTIFGRVTDPNGGLVSGATVTILNQNTGATRGANTDDKGEFLVSPLPIGKYTVKVAMTGFNEAIVADLTLEIQEKREVNLSLQVAGTAETVTNANRSD